MRRNCKKLAVFLISTCLLTGCGNPMNKMKESTVYLNKHGVVESLSVEAFDKAYYDENELKNFIDEEIKAQQTLRGEESLSLEEFEVKEEKATLRVKYKTVEDYTEFTDTKFESGKYKADILSDDQTLIQVETKEEVDKANIEAEGLSYIKIQDPDGIQLLIDGSISYYSKGMEFVEKNLIKVPAGQECIILYQQK